MGKRGRLTATRSLRLSSCSTSPLSDTVYLVAFICIVVSAVLQSNPCWSLTRDGSREPLLPANAPCSKPMGTPTVLCQKGCPITQVGYKQSSALQGCQCRHRAQKALKASKKIKHPDIFWASKPVTDSLRCKSEGNGRGHQRSTTQITTVETPFTLFLHSSPRKWVWTQMDPDNSIRIHNRVLL